MNLTSKTQIWTNGIHESWMPFFYDQDVQDILENIQLEIGDDYYPLPQNVLRFARNDLEQIRHVIIGMEPYPSYNEEDNCPQATGRSFEVSELQGKGWNYKFKQSSLRNILKALYYNETHTSVSLEKIRKAIETGSFVIPAPTRWFDMLEAQGVVFLNSTLTVKPKTPGSHQEYWAPFRNVFVPFLMKRNISWHLWGKNAQSEYGVLLGNDEQKLEACHPRLASFVTENTFQYAADIDWIGKSILAEK